MRTIAIANQLIVPVVQSHTVIPRASDSANAARGFRCNGVCRAEERKTDLSSRSAFSCRFLRRAAFLLLLVLVQPLRASNPIGSIAPPVAEDTHSTSMTDTIFNLDEVAVYAVRGRDIVPAQKLRGESLQRLSAYSVADAIRYFSGVQVKDYGGVGGLKTIDIRSMGTNHSGIFYDGIQLGNAQNGQIDLGKFSLDNIEEISLYNGQKSGVFQSAKDFGSAGTVYLRSRRPQFKEGKSYNVRQAFRTGSFGLLDYSAACELELTRRVALSMNGEVTHATGRYPFRYRKVMADGAVAWDTTAVRENGDIKGLRLEGGLYGTMDEGTWHAKTYYYDSERGIPGAIVNNVWKRSQRQWDRNFFFQGQWQRTFGRYELQASGKYARDYMHYLNPDTMLMYIDNEFWQQEAYVSVAQHFRLSEGWDVGLSTDYQQNWLSASLANFVNPRRGTLLVAAASTYEVGRLKLLGSLLGTMIYDEMRTPTAQLAMPVNSYGRPRLTPALFVTYKPLPEGWEDDLTVRAFYKRIFRMPTFNDLYYTDIGNISLRPEWTTQYDLGLQYAKAFYHQPLSLLEVKVDGYYNDVTDKIIAVPKGNGQYRWMMMNIGRVKVRGLDANVNSRCELPHNLSLQTGVAYTYQRAEDYSDPSDTDPIYGTYRQQIAYIPWHSGSATAGITWNSWSLNYSFCYVGERYHNSCNIPENREQPWYTHDLGVSWNFSQKIVNGAVAVEVNNLFNQQYDVVKNYPMPGRNYKITLRCEL